MYELLCLRPTGLELAVVTGDNRDTALGTEYERAILDPSHPLDPVPPLLCLQHRPVLRLQPLHTQPRPFRTLYNQ